MSKLNMLHKLTLLLTIATLSLLAGCGGRSLDVNHPISIEPVYGSNLNGVAMSELSDESLRLSFNEVPDNGQYLRLSLPAGLTVGAEIWNGDNGTVHLVAPVEAGVEIGIAPSPGYAGGPVSLELDLVERGRTASVPPVGERNVIDDLTITDHGGGQIELSWTMINVGDYDFNGEVNIADLTPLGIHLGSTYDRTAQGARQSSIYWVDGDANGEVNLADITSIGSNYRAQVVGYNVRRNGEPVPGPIAGGPTVPVEDATHNPGLPMTFSLTFNGASADLWSVAPVDADGIEGADSEGSTGTPEALALRASLNITGTDVFDQSTGADGGPFGPGKFSTRIIDPGDIVNRFNIGNATIVATTAEYRSVPRGRTYLVDFIYRPVTDPLTGVDRGSSSLRSASAAEDEIITSVPVFIPEGTEDPVELETEIEFVENPEGGMFVDVMANMTIPGDNPATPEVETSYNVTEHNRLDYVAGIISQDTDDNGLFDDEAEIKDEDRDCVSEQRGKRHDGGNEDDDDDESGPEFSVEGILDFFDEEAGLLVLRNAQVDDGAGEFTVDPVVTIEFDETANFERRIRTDDDDTEEDMDPSELTIGDEMEVYLRSYIDENGEQIIEMWGILIRQEIDLRTDD